MVDLSKVKIGDKIKFQTLTNGRLQTAIGTVTWIGYGMVTVTRFDNQSLFVVLAHEIESVEVKPC